MIVLIRSNDGVSTMADEMVTQQLQELNSKIADLSNKIELNSKIQQLTEALLARPARLASLPVDRSKTLRELTR